MQSHSSPMPDNALLLSRGYGYVPMAVMAARDLTPNAKALYAYLCALAGRDGVAWPSAGRICDELGMGPTAFRSALRRLTDAGYVAVERVKQRGRFARNVYTLARMLPEGPLMDTPAAGAPPSGNPPADCPRTEDWTATNTSFPNTIPNDTITDDDDDASPLTRAHACEARREGIRREFAGCFSREALAAEADLLAGLLGRCDAPALTRLIRASAEHAPRSPAPYVRQMMQKYRSDAIAYGLMRSSMERLTEEILDRVDAKNDGFAIAPALSAQRRFSQY